MSIANRYKLFLLFATLTILFLWLSQLVGGWMGVGGIVGLTILMHFKIKVWTGATLLYLHDAKELEESDDPELFCIAQQLAQRANLPLPRFYVMPGEAPNSFAVGRNTYRTSIVLTAGLRQVLSRDEQAAVIAHELAHIKGGDTPIMSVVAILASTPYLVQKVILQAWLGEGEGSRAEGVRLAVSRFLGVVSWGLMIPLAAMLTRFILNSFKEFEADEVGAWLTGEPLVLASALQKMDAALSYIPMATATPATAHLFMVNPYLKSPRRWLVKVHPATCERIAYLEELGRQRQDSDFAA